MSGHWDSRHRWYGRTRAVSGAVTVAALVLTYVLFYRPAIARARVADAQLRQARSELAAVDRKLESLPAVRQEVARLAARVESFHHPIPASVDPVALVQDVERAARQALVRKLTCQPQPPQKVGDLEALPLAVAFEADFVAAFNFLKQLESDQHLARIRNVRLRTKPTKPGQVDVQISMTSYSAEP